MMAQALAPMYTSVDLGEDPGSWLQFGLALDFVAISGGMNQQTEDLSYSLSLPFSYHLCKVVYQRNKYIFKKKKCTKIVFLVSYGLS